MVESGRGGGRCKDFLKRKAGTCLLGTNSNNLDTERHLPVFGRRALPQSFVIKTSPLRVSEMTYFIPISNHQE